MDFGLADMDLLAGVEKHQSLRDVGKRRGINKIWSKEVMICASTLLYSKQGWSAWGSRWDKARE